jgi:phage gp29-like protein
MSKSRFGDAIIQRESRDRYRRFLTDFPSPEKFATLLRNAEYDIGSLSELQEEIEAKSGFIRGVVNTRRGAFCSLDWDVVPDPDLPDTLLSKAVADHVRNELRTIRFVYPGIGLPPRGFADALRFLSTAIGPNVAACELVWSLGRLIEMRPVPGHRLTLSNFDAKLAVETDEDFALPLDFAPYKFVVHSPEPRAGMLTRSTMTHATAWLYLVQYFAWKDWMAFSELYGTPWRVGKFTGEPPDADREQFRDMLANLGPDIAALIPSDWSVETVTVSGTGEAYQRLMDKAEKSLSILWLGQTLTTDIGDVGSRAAAEVHDNVRQDIMACDLADEAAMVREQIIRPIVRLAFPTMSNAPIPAFKRLIETGADARDAYPVIAQINAAASLGLPVDLDEVYFKLNLVRPPQGTGSLMIQPSQGQPPPPPGETP